MLGSQHWEHTLLLESEYKYLDIILNHVNVKSSLQQGLQVKIWINLFRS